MVCRLEFTYDEFSVEKKLLVLWKDFFLRDGYFLLKEEPWYFSVQYEQFYTVVWRSLPDPHLSKVLAMSWNYVFRLTIQIYFISQLVIMLRHNHLQSAMATLAKRQKAMHAQQFVA